MKYHFDMQSNSSALLAEELAKLEQIFAADFEEYYIHACAAPCPNAREECFKEWTIRKLAAHSIVLGQILAVTKVIHDHSKS
jgi:hypothetical protein